MVSDFIDEYNGYLVAFTSAIPPWKHKSGSTNL